MAPKRKSRGRVLVTGGPTRAYLDRVRFLTNFSTGELAYVLCRELTRSGFEVALVSGPTAQPFHELNLDAWSPIETTEEMHGEVMRLCRSFRPDFAVFTAAVLDFAPATRRAGKVSSKTTTWKLTLKPTPKIIDEVGRRFPDIRRVGFKLEWERKGRATPEAQGRAILERKKLDALCLNFLSEIAGKSHPALLLSKDGGITRAKDKREIARAITRLLSDGI